MRLKKVKFILIALFILSNLSCRSFEEKKFLREFQAIDTYPTTDIIYPKNSKRPKKIPEKYLSEILNVNETLINKDFWYGYSYRINDKYYLLQYTYSPRSLVFIDVLCVYDLKKNMINSELVISSTLGITSTYKNGEIKLRKRQNSTINNNDRYTVEKYKVNSNFKFNKID